MLYHSLNTMDQPSVGCGTVLLTSTESSPHTPCPARSQYQAKNGLGLSQTDGRACFPKAVWFKSSNDRGKEKEVWHDQKHQRRFKCTSQERAETYTESLVGLRARCEAVATSRWLWTTLRTTFRGDTLLKHSWTASPGPAPPLVSTVTLITLTSVDLKSECGFRKF